MDVESEEEDSPPPAKKQKKEKGGSKGGSRGCRYEEEEKSLFKEDLTGVVKKWDKQKGFGFITPDDGGDDVFVHTKDLFKGGGLERLMPGDKVCYEQGEDLKTGKTKALEVRVTEFSKRKVRKEDEPDQEGQLLPTAAPKSSLDEVVEFMPPQPAPQGPQAMPPIPAPSPFKEGSAIIPLQLRGDGFCSRAATAKNKGNTRHLCVADLVKVGGLLKKPIPHVTPPCGLFAVFDGNPFAAEMCAKNLHTKILTSLSKAEAACGEQDLRRAVHGALTELDQENRDAQPGSEGCGAAVALVTGQSLVLVRSGKSGALLCQLKELAEGGNDEESFGRVHEICNIKMPAAKHLGAANKGGPTPNLGAIDGVKRTASVGAQAQKHQTNAAGKSLSSEDVKVIPLTKAHDFFILGSSELMTQARHSVLMEAVVKNRDKPKDASTAAAKVALDNRLHGKSAKEQVAWVLAEQNQSGAELACIVGFLEWDKPEFIPEAAPPKKAEVKQVVVQGKSVSTGVTGVGLAQGARKLPEPIAGPGIDKNTHVFGLRIKPTRKT